MKFGSHLSDEAALQDCTASRGALGKGVLIYPVSHPLASMPQLAVSYTSGKNNTKKSKSSTGKAVIFGSRNGLTVLANALTNRPERRAAHIASELDRYRVYITTLCDTDWLKNT